MRPMSAKVGVIPNADGSAVLPSEILLQSPQSMVLASSQHMQIQQASCAAITIFSFSVNDRKNQVHLEDLKKFQK